MTNATIILNESLRLMEEGVIKGSGQFAEIENEDGSKETIELPEEIHTFNGWKERGFGVKKGEKSKIKFSIWKCSAKKIEDENGEEDERTSMFMKLSAFFTREQVEVMKGGAR